VQINAADSVRGFTALHWACATNHVSAVNQLLLAHGVNTAQPATESGDTALHVAAREGHDSVASRLLESVLASTRTQLLAAQNRDGLTPCEVAQSRGNAGLARLLLLPGVVLDTSPSSASSDKGDECLGFDVVGSATPIPRASQPATLAAKVKVAAAAKATESPADRLAERKRRHTEYMRDKRVSTTTTAAALQGHIKGLDMENVRLSVEVCRCSGGFVLFVFNGECLERAGSAASARGYSVATACGRIGDNVSTLMTIL
jgi:ankyrin repeat protein